MKKNISICIICGNTCYYSSRLLQGRVYHVYCYQKVLKQLRNLNSEILRKEETRSALLRKLHKSSLFKSSFKRFLLNKYENLGSLKPRILYLQRELHELYSSKEIYEKILERLYSYWPTTPPDWEKRQRVVLRRQNQCFSCGEKRPYLSIHHKIPIDHGGTHHLTNLIALCGKCENNRVHRVEIQKNTVPANLSPRVFY